MAGDTAELGRWCLVHDGKLTEWWRIVLHEDADALRRCISERTLLAQALLGHQAGDRVHVRGPGRLWTVLLLEVKQGPSMVAP